MPSNREPLTDAQLAAKEAGRDIGAEILAGIRDVKAGRTRAVYSPVVAARQKSGLSQSGFAAAMGVSVRTLQQWEQGRRQPTGAAKALLQIAERAPDALVKAGLVPAA
ncbi:helix-turn-helix domain-containing protein [Ottowia sp.]|jgi:putative transcriptional regulator|uniref:helix-turn-helix domain-containing protein n=1 Tax=Ottowia sp. TaxID=1898956 RepID=UPI0025EC8CEA|nr:helix-turn-helix domain-containing protein [Ottowia sp.]MBK6747041.1 helix-turn-helix domain-containing protein [Ottowia sp.]